MQDSCEMPSFPCKEGSEMSEGQVREFETGATRDDNSDKRDYEGFISPLVVWAFGEYMHQHRFQSDGSLRDSDNWQQGIPLSSYMKSMWRHFLDLWMHHRGYNEMAREDIQEALCGILFNGQGYLHELLKDKLPEGEDA